MDETTRLSSIPVRESPYISSGLGRLSVGGVLVRTTRLLAKPIGGRHPFGSLSIEHRTVFSECTIFQRLLLTMTSLFTRQDVVAMATGIKP